MPLAHRTRQTSRTFGTTSIIPMFNRLEKSLHSVATQEKTQRTAGGRQEKQPEVGWFPWHLGERPFCCRPRVAPCDEVVQINPPFHPARLLACVEAALMGRIHAHKLLFDFNMFGLRNECMGGPCPLCLRTYKHRSGG